MPIRPAKYADLLPASKLAASAFDDDDMFGDRLHPHRKQYPDDVYLFHLQGLRKDYFDAHTRIMVSFEGDKPDVITGMAVWLRRGEGGNHIAAQQPWLHWFISWMLPVYNMIEPLVWPNRALDAKEVKSMDESMPFIEQYWEKEGYTETWDLVMLFQGPEYQGKGYAKELVLWGIERAKEDGVRVGLISTTGKEGFYIKLGIDEHVGNASDGGKENPFHDLAGGKILFSKKFEKMVQEM